MTVINAYTHVVMTDNPPLQKDLITCTYVICYDWIQMHNSQKSYSQNNSYEKIPFEIKSLKIREV